MLLGSAALVFMILMALTIGALVVVMNIRGLAADYTVAIVMTLLALLSCTLLILLFRHMTVTTS